MIWTVLLIDLNILFLFLLPRCGIGCTTLVGPTDPPQVMVRNYADMLWSSYNFWCKREYDGEHCDYSKWADPAHHRRSPELFHELVTLDANRTEGVVQPFYYPMEKPCINAGGYYHEFVLNFLASRQLQNYTVLVAAEELDAFPLHVLRRISALLQYDTAGVDLEPHLRVRVNTQELKGTTASVRLQQYRPGRYNISGYRPMLSETRALLDRCWEFDCKKLAEMSPYRYTACFPEQQLLSAAPSYLQQLRQQQRQPPVDDRDGGASGLGRQQFLDLLASRRIAARVSMPWE